MLLAWLLHEFAIIIASNCCCLCGERQKESLDGKKGFIKKSLLSLFEEVNNFPAQFGLGAQYTKISTVDSRLRKDFGSDQNLS